MLQLRGIDPSESWLLAETVTMRGAASTSQLPFLMLYFRHVPLVVSKPETEKNSGSQFTKVI